MRLILPYPPSVNQYYRALPPYGRVIISSRGRLYRANVIDFVGRAYSYLTTMTDRLRVDITINQPDRRKRDLDNILKPLLDSLTYAHVWADDSQIDMLTVERGVIKRGGEVIVNIERYGGTESGSPAVSSDDISGSRTQTRIQSQPSRKA